VVGNAIGEMLPSAFGIAISPIPVIAVVLVLVTPRASVNGPMFVIGWCLGIGIVVGLTLTFASGVDASEGDEPASWVAWLNIFLGALLLALAFKQWQSRNADSPEPAWMAALDTLRRAGYCARGIHCHRVHRHGRARRHLLPPGVEVEGHPRWREGLDAA